MTERPELFAAVIDGVGWSNPLRYVAEQNGYGEEPEWGAIAEPAGYRALKSIDSYQAVKDGTRYPAVLLTTGVTDPRVAPFHVAQDGGAAAGGDRVRASRSCCASTSTPATASARRGPSRMRKRPTRTRSCSARHASATAFLRGGGELSRPVDDFRGCLPTGVFKGARL